MIALYRDTNSNLQSSSIFDKQSELKCRLLSKLDFCRSSPMSVTQVTAQQPEFLLHYQLGQSLGEGGFGQVFQAWDTKLHRQVAIKYLKNVSTGVDLLREARLAASLQHPAFVKVHALEQTSDSQAIVMEMVPGRTLRQLLETQPPSIHQVLDIVRQVAQAMQEAHAAGLIHGDLKPSNLMQEPGGAVRILDFGLASQADRDATTSVVQADPQGTIAYMAPEILTGASMRACSDIYALGVILYELLTGSRPFANLSGLALAAAVIQSNSDQWPWPDHLPLALRQLVRAMTARQLEHRIASMQEVVLQINQLIALDPPSMGSASFKMSGINLAALPPQDEAPIVNWRRLFKSSRPILLVFTVLILAFVGWQTQPYWPRVETQLKNYSEAREMKAGLAALEQADRAEMLDQAEVHFTRILEQTPEHTAARASLALVDSYRYVLDAQNTAALERAEANAKKALEQNDFLALTHIAYSRVLSLREQHEAAQQEIDRAFALDPKNPQVWLNKILGQLRAEKVKEAMESAQQATQLFPQNVSFSHQLAQIYVSQQNYSKAIEVYQQSIERSSATVATYIGLARAQVKMNQVEAALQTLQQGLKLRETGELYAELGDTLFLRGDYVGAATAFEKAVNKVTGNPDDFRTWAKYADTLQWIPGRMDSAKNAYATARDLIKPKLEKSPKDTDLLSRTALYNAKNGDISAAHESIAALDGLIEQNPLAQFRVGVSYEVLGKREAAVEAVLKAKSLGYPIKLIDADPDLVSLRRDPLYLRKPNKP